jgi:hypothetical protein
LSLFSLKGAAAAREGETCIFRRLKSKIKFISAYAHPFQGAKAFKPSSRTPLMILFFAALGRQGGLGYPPGKIWFLCLLSQAAGNLQFAPSFRFSRPGRGKVSELVEILS